MTREVRITIDDDEVFARMKARKQELDLSWEEVLHRGLRRGKPGGGSHGVGGPSGSGGPGGYGDWSQWVPDDVGPEAGEGSYGPSGSTDEPESIGEAVEDLKRHVRGQVAHSLRESMDAMEEVNVDLEAEMTELENAEDAVLRFDGVTDDDRRYEVPLRVRLETSRDGLDVEVVAVREGKSVSGMNRFDRETRRAVNEHLARGGTATLAFEGAERYEVGPVCSWSRDDGGRPTVSTVDIEEVLFDDE